MVFPCFHIVSCSRTFFKKDFIYLFLEKGKGGSKRQRETSTCGCLSRTPYWGPDLQPRHEPWLDWESNQPPFGLQASTQSTEPHQLARTFFLNTDHSFSHCYTMLCHILNFTNDGGLFLDSLFCFIGLFVCWYHNFMSVAYNESVYLPTSPSLSFFFNNALAFCIST